MKADEKAATTRVAIAMALAAALLAVLMVAPANAAEPAAKEKRYLVRFDHGSANLGPWQEIALYVGPRRVLVYSQNELVHEIPAEALTGVTHELRVPFDPAKATERVFNNTLGSCSDLLTCPVLGAAGVVGAAGVGIATLFTPKENIITLNWNEAGEARTLGMKIAWYQRDFILRAIERETGVKASERKPGMPHARRPQNALVSSLPSGVAPAATGAATPVALPATPPPALRPADGAATGPIQGMKIVLERDALVCNMVLRRGEYVIYMQERTNGVVVAFTLAAEQGQVARILTRVLAASEPAPETQSVSVTYADAQSVTSIREIRLPGRTLRLPA